MNEFCVKCHSFKLMKSWFVVILRLAATAIPVRLCFWVSLSNCF